MHMLIVFGGQRPLEHWIRASTQFSSRWQYNWTRKVLHMGDNQIVLRVIRNRIDLEDSLQGMRIFDVVTEDESFRLKADRFIVDMWPGFVQSHLLRQV